MKMTNEIGFSVWTHSETQELGVMVLGVMSTEEKRQK